MGPRMARIISAVPSADPSSITTISYWSCGNAWACKASSVRCRTSRLLQVGMTTLTSIASGSGLPCPKMVEVVGPQDAGQEDAGQPGEPPSPGSVHPLHRVSRVDGAEPTLHGIRPPMDGGEARRKSGLQRRVLRDEPQRRQGAFFLFGKQPREDERALTAL